MTTKKIEIEKEEKKEVKTSKYFYAIGRRKTAVARVKLFVSEDKQNSFDINGKKLTEYFPAGRAEEVVKEPLALAGEGNKFAVVSKVLGGGCTAQSEAIRLGIARALVVFNEELKKSLKDKGLLTRDSRKVERKKPGLKKARKSPQWAKR